LGHERTYRKNVAVYRIMPQDFLSVKASNFISIRCDPLTKVRGIQRYRLKSCPASPERQEDQ